MGMGRVAVADSLGPVAAGLRAAGHGAVSWQGTAPPGVVAVVLSGLADDVAGRTDGAADVPVVDAAGRTVDAVERAAARAPR
jgi:hypothetical protein